MRFIMWCRWGAMPLEAAEVHAAILEAMAHAVKNGFSVTVTDGEFDDVATIPPTIQSDVILPLVFGEMVPEVSPARN
jgi:hypothetical protein